MGLTTSVCLWGGAWKAGGGAGANDWKSIFKPENLAWCSVSVSNTLVVQSTLTWILWPYRGRGGAESLPLLRGPLAESGKADSLLPTREATLPERLPAARTLLEKETKQSPWVLGLSHVAPLAFLSKALSREFLCLGIEGTALRSP